MEKPRLDWKTFTARRRLDIGTWIKSKGFKTYSDLKKWLIKNEMEAPTKEEVAEYFKKSKKEPLTVGTAKEELQKQDKEESIQLLDISIKEEEPRKKKTRSRSNKEVDESSSK